MEFRREATLGNWVLDAAAYKRLLLEKLYIAFTNQWEAKLYWIPNCDLSSKKSGIPLVELKTHIRSQEGVEQVGV